MTSPIPESLVLRATHALRTSLPGAMEGTVLLAVSGGADSMALLHLLHRGGVTVAVAHFDHQTRNGASTAEGDFVTQVAAELGVPVHRGSGDVAVEAAASQESFEMVARRVRYAFLVEAARAGGYRALITGHHADDQAETVLMRALRGTSPTGLAGIQAVGAVSGLPLLRPLLSFRRAELEAWLRGEGLGWMEDASNQVEDVVRNRVRHQLLPLLARDYNPRVVEALNRMAALQRRESVLLTRLAEEAQRTCVDQTGMAREAFATLDEALQFRMMTMGIQAAGGEATADTVDRAVVFMGQGDTGKQLDVGNRVCLRLSREHGVFEGDTPSSKQDHTWVLPVPGDVVVEGCTVLCRVLDRAPDGPLKSYCSPTRQVFDGAVLSGALTLRTRLRGDRFQPLGMSGTKKLKDYFNDLGLSRAERDRQLLVLCDDEILWVVGHGISRTAAVTESTKSWIEINMVDDEATGTHDEITPER